LESGSATVRDLVRTIAKSQEYSDRFFSASPDNSAAYNRAVGMLYQRLVNQQPNALDRRTLVRAATAGGLSAVVDNIVSSADYRRAFGEWEVPGSNARYCARGSQSASDTRFRGMDVNNDGVITRREWRGNAQSFRTHDWNRDGVLSGEEVRAGGFQNGDDLAGGRVDRFNDLDTNRDGRVEWREWIGSVDAFESLDRNSDNVLSRTELGRSTGAIGTSGQFVVVDARERWTDSGIDVRVGDSIYFDADGTVQLSPDRNDVATPQGSRTNRLAPNAPLRDRPAGALVARIGNREPMFVGARGSISRAPTSGRLYLTVNDDYLGDNSGDFRVTVDVR
jgi:Ca2+-binding EF-hand superfamily protein